MGTGYCLWFTNERELQFGFLILLIQNNLSANFLVICAKIAGVIVKIETKVTFRKRCFTSWCERTYEWTCNVKVSLFVQTMNGSLQQTAKGKNAKPIETTLKKIWKIITFLWRFFSVCFSWASLLLFQTKSDVIYSFTVQLLILIFNLFFRTLSCATTVPDRN